MLWEFKVNSCFKRRIFNQPSNTQSLDKTFRRHHFLLSLLGLPGLAGGTPQRESIWLTAALRQLSPSGLSSSFFSPF